MLEDFYKLVALKKMCHIERLGVETLSQFPLIKNVHIQFSWRRGALTY